MTAPICPDCGQRARLHMDSSKFYGGRDYGPLWKCPTRGCDRQVGTRDGEFDTRPRGPLVDRATRQARVKAHQVFDRLWKSGGMSRTQAYAWLSRMLGLARERAHIGQLDQKMCEHLTAEAERKWREIYEPGAPPYNQYLEEERSGT